MSFSYTIQSAEYFVDSDPGEGNGVAIDVVYEDIEVIDLDFEISTSSLSWGVHNIYIRFQDSNNSWSVAKGYTVTITNPDSQDSNIQSAEYFIDSDPGEGNAIPIDAAYGGELSELDFEISTSDLSFGEHSVFLRYQDSEGTWSIPKIHSFTVSNPNPPSYTIHAAEYFIDSDPGEGNGIPIESADGFYDTYIESIDIDIDTNDIPIGQHWLFFRYQDSEGIWSNPIFSPFTVTTPEINYTIQSAEYFIDSDPGEGNAIPIDAAYGGELSELDFEISTSDLSFGEHSVFLRYQDSEGTWSIPKIHSFTVSNPNPPSYTIHAAEYFIDSDPGEGNGIPIESTYDSYTSDLDFEISTLDFSWGVHDVYLRFQDSDGVWSVPKGHSITITNPDSQDSNIQSAEYFIDSDPGEGNAIPIDAAYGGELSELDFEISTTNLTFGEHSVYLRFLDDQGHWSNATGYYFTVTFSLGDINMDSQIDVIDVVILINYILEISDISDIQFLIGDVNLDNEINIVDCVLIVQLILSN